MRVAYIRRKRPALISLPKKLFDGARYRTLILYDENVNQTLLLSKFGRCARWQGCRIAACGLIQLFQQCDQVSHSPIITAKDY